MIALPASAQNVINTLRNAGFEAYAVGGSVRDQLMSRPTKGWDFATNATPQQILTLFPDSFYDNQFGTVGVKVVTEAGEDMYEVTTYRSEGGYSNHRHPDTVTWGTSLEEDLSRRDFTVNAIAFDGKKIIDPFAGCEDIKRKIIRAVGSPNERFGEDALRMMRGIRLAAELAFMIDQETFNAIKHNVSLIEKISKERVRDELLRTLSSNFPADGVLLLKNSGLLAIIMPELEEAFSVPQKSPKRHHMYDVGTHSVMALRYCPSADPIVRLATLTHDIGKLKTFHKDASGLITFYNHEVVGARIARSICARLRLSKKQTDKLVTLVRWHQFSVDERQTDSALRRFIRRVGKENLADILALRIGDRLGGGARETSWRLELYKRRLEEVQKQPFTVADLTIDGFDVMKEFDSKPGPLVGQVLNQLFSEVEAGTIPNERETLLKRMKELEAQRISS